MTPLSVLVRPALRRGISLAEDLPPGMDALHEELSRLVEACAESARRDGRPPSLVEEIRYALCAWLDERVFAATPFSIDWLPHSLVVAHFRDPSAGVNFFRRMERLHQRSEDEEGLEVFSRCILLGFRGMYRIDGRERLSGLLRDAMGKNRDPGWDAPPWFQALRVEPGPAGGRVSPRTLAAVAAAIAGLSLLGYLVLAGLSRIA